MSEIIGADAAKKLAGLQIDLLQKYRNGHISLEEMSWWLNLNQLRRQDIMEAEKRCPVSPCYKSRSGEWLPIPDGLLEKFALLVDLGIITVPDDYDHTTWLTKFKDKHQSGENESFYKYNDAITDDNFPNPSRILKPGDKLWVRVFQQIVSDPTTSAERMVFLATQKAVYAGAQGLSLVFDQKRDQLPRDKWCTSFDEKDRLWADAGGDHRVPYSVVDSDGAVDFRLGRFELFWNDGFTFLCFTEVKEAGKDDHLLDQGIAAHIAGQGPSY